MSEKPGATQSNGITSAITKLLSGDSGQKLIMALVVLAGGSNLLNTNSTARLNQDDLNRALQEIHALHQALDPMMNRQKTMADDVDKIEKHLEAKQ